MTRDVVVQAMARAAVIAAAVAASASTEAAGTALRAPHQPLTLPLTLLPTQEA